MASKPSLQLAAAHVLRDVIDHGRSLDQSIAAQSKRVAPADRAALRELGYGGCRHYGYLDGVIGGLLAKPIRRKDRMLHFLLVAGLYQIRFMRVPDHAAVNQTVAALGASRQSWARGLVNGVLRNVIRAREEGRFGELEAKLTPPQSVSLPDPVYQWFRQSWPDECEAIFQAIGERPPMTLRVNMARTTRQDYLALLKARGIPALATTESPCGVTLDQPMAVEEIPMFAEGWVSVQDESAQLCTAAMALEPGLRVLDGCAAPGGKTCAMLEAEPGIEMTAVDLPERSQPIHQNLARIGLEAEVWQSGLGDLAQNRNGRLWDRILLDVPCSGTGVIRRHPDIRHRRLEGDLESFAGQQRGLLDTAWGMLSPGGMLLYVTCSVMPTENDGVIGTFLAARDDARAGPPPGIAGITTTHGCQRLPGIHPGDGFYYCRLGKL